jgi:hypothetical protein
VVQRVRVARQQVVVAGGGVVGEVVGHGLRIRGGSLYRVMLPTFLFPS